MSQPQSDVLDRTRHEAKQTTHSLTNWVTVDLAKSCVYTDTCISIFISIGSLLAFRALLDNYESEVDKPEEITETEEQENWHFLDLIINTPVMQHTHQYLVDQGKAKEDPEEFRKQLYDIWFRLYRRCRSDE